MKRLIVVAGLSLTLLLALPRGSAFATTGVQVTAFRACHAVIVGITVPEGVTAHGRATLVGSDGRKVGKRWRAGPGHIEVTLPLDWREPPSDAVVVGRDSTRQRFTLRSEYGYGEPCPR